MIDGKKVDMEIVVNDTVQRHVRETAKRESAVEPNWMDTLRFWVVVGALVGLGVYAIATFSLWLREVAAIGRDQDQLVCNCDRGDFSVLRADPKGAKLLETSVGRLVKRDDREVREID
jgi:hypothetical protein